jgi:hypothetical protein
MKFNSNQKTVNEVKNAYTFYLQPNLGKIYAMSKNPKVSLGAMKGIIRSYISPATYSYPENQLTKKAWFQDELESLETKKQVYLFCRNSVRKAKQTIAR